MYQSNIVKIMYVHPFMKSHSL